MIEEMRQQRQLVLKLLNNLSNKADQLQTWSDYHNQRLLVFASNKIVLIISLGFVLMLDLLSFVFGLSLNNFGLTLLGYLLFFLSIALIYYLIIWQKLFTELSKMSLELQKHALEMKTKPAQTIINRLLELGGAFLQEKFEKWRKE